MEKLNNYSHYFFDADGTMIDTEEMVYLTYKETCKKFAGIEITKKQVTDLMGIPFVHQIKSYLGDLDENTLQEVRKFYKEFQMGIYKDHVKLFPKIKDTLTTLKKQGKKLAVVSSRTEPSLRLFLNEVGIIDYFDLIVAPQQTKNHKPHPEPVQYALEKLEGDAEQTLFIGDATFDIQSGRSAGTHTALVAWGPNDIDDFDAEPHFILEDMDQLI